jgi:hypothetical protein
MLRAVSTNDLLARVVYLFFADGGAFIPLGLFLYIETFIKSFRAPRTFTNFF